MRDSTGSLLCEISGPCPILSEFRVHGLAAADLKEVAHCVQPPPDAHEPEGTLTAIETSQVGPADRLTLDLGKRLTVNAGDNGLGKSFLLDVAL